MKPLQAQPSVVAVIVWGQRILTERVPDIDTGFGKRQAEGTFLAKGSELDIDAL